MISGKGQLTLASINTIQNIYVLSICTHKVDCAILELYYSIADEPKNKEYPIGFNLWWSFQRETANHMNKHVPIKNSFSPAVVIKI